MRNPWLSLSSNAPYLLESDKVAVRSFAARQTSASNLHLDSIPEPFIGNPETARVVLLLLNPGHSPSDPLAHRDPQLKQAIFKNLRGEPQRYPFYPLNPELSKFPTAKWWLPRTKQLRKESGLSDEVLSERILAIEWFPYHSSVSGLPSRPVCQSQDYGFELATRMFNEGRFILRMRAEKRWKAIEPKFAQVPSLKYPRIGYITRGNTESGVFEQILKALK